MTDEKSSPQDAITDAFKERIAHPVLGVLAIAWVVCNWKVLFFLAFAGSPAAYRIADAPKYFDSATLIGWPAIATVLYVLLAPVLKAAALRWSNAVEDHEFERHYQQRLQQIKREQHLIQLQIQSGEPALRLQQDNKVRLEAELASLSKRVDEGKQVVKDLEDLKSGEWDRILNEPLLNRPDESQRLMQLTQAMDRLAAFRPRVEARLDKFRQDREHRRQG